MEGEDPPEARVADLAINLPAQFPESSQCDESAQILDCATRIDQSEGRIEVGVHEAVEFRVEDAVQPSPQRTVSLRFFRPADTRDFGSHVVGVGVNIESGAVCESRVVRRIELVHNEFGVCRVGVGADGRKSVFDEFGHREHRCAVVDAVVTALVDTDSPADRAVALEDRDVAAGATQIQPRRQSGKSRADDHDSIGRRADGSSAVHVCHGQ